MLKPFDCEIQVQSCKLIFIFPAITSLLRSFIDIYRHLYYHYVNHCRTIWDNEYVTAYMAPYFQDMISS